MFIGIAPALAASVTWTFATIPDPIPLEFAPVTRQVKESAVEAHEIDFPAAAEAGPFVALIRAI